MESDLVIQALTEIIIRSPSEAQQRGSIGDATAAQRYYQRAALDLHGVWRSLVFLVGRFLRFGNHFVWSPTLIWQTWILKFAERF